MVASTDIVRKGYCQLLSKSVFAALLTACLALGTASCLREPGSAVVAYVRNPETTLWNQLGPSSSPAKSLPSGERVEILRRRPRWVQVRTADGQTGWAHAEALASLEVFQQFQRLAGEIASLPSQGAAIARRPANLHLEPSRHSETFDRLAEGEEVDVVAHRVSERTPNSSAQKKFSPAKADSRTGESARVEIGESDDWLLVRGVGQQAGWVLESSLDMNVPMEIAQYNEGLRIRAWFVLYTEQDKSGEHPWYLWATIRPRRGLPFDYDEIRVFVWNPRNSRYETSYRERNLIGFYPIQVGTRQTPSGPSPTFSLQLEDETGERFQKNYSMAGRLVRPLPREAGAGGTM